MTLLGRIRENLDDDEPRLVYADALQDAGDPRGELIMVQCELARFGVSHLRAPPGWLGEGLAAASYDRELDARVKVLRARERALLAEHGLSLAGAAGTMAYHFHRGFVASVTLDKAFFERNHFSGGNPEALFEAAPMLESVFLTNKLATADIDALLRSPSTVQLKDLLLRGSGDIEGLCESTRTLGLSRLTFLNAVSGAAIERFVQTALFRQLRVLELENQTLGVPWVEQIGHGGGRLSALHLANADVGTAGALALAKAPHLGDLEVLGLRSNAMKDEGATALAQTGGLPKLRALELRNNGLGPSAFAAIGEAFPELVLLDLSQNAPRIDGFRALARGAGLGKLRALSLRMTKVSDSALKALVASPLFRRLRVLNLSCNAITEKGAKLLAASEASGLVSLDLRDNPLEAAGREALANSPHLQSVKVTF